MPVRVCFCRETDAEVCTGSGEARSVPERILVGKLLTHLGLLAPLLGLELLAEGFGCLGGQLEALHGGLFVGTLSVVEVVGVVLALLHCAVYLETESV